MKALTCILIFPFSFLVWKNNYEAILMSVTNNVHGVVYCGFVAVNLTQCSMIHCILIITCKFICIV